MNYVDTYIAECPACRAHIDFDEVVAVDAEAKPYVQIRHECAGGKNILFSAMCIGRKRTNTSALEAPAG
jgi:hypothetical protein